MYRFFFHIKVSLEIFGMQFKNKFTERTKKQQKVNISTCPIFSPSKPPFVFSTKTPMTVEIAFQSTGKRYSVLPTVSFDV